MARGGTDGEIERERERERRGRGEGERESARWRSKTLEIKQEGGRLEFRERGDARTFLRESNERVFYTC